MFEVVASFIVLRFLGNQAEQRLSQPPNRAEAQESKTHFYFSDPLFFRFPSSFSGFGGDDLYAELWKLCAGPLVDVPRPGERVFYFPQGHMEQVQLTLRFHCFCFQRFQISKNRSKSAFYCCACFQMFLPYWVL
jgi:hypothetical protein